MSTKTQRPLPTGDLYSHSLTPQLKLNDNLQKTQPKFHQCRICQMQEIMRLRELCEKKAYSNLNIQPLQYLFIVFEQRRQHLGSQADTMEGIMKNHHKKVVSDILKQNIKIQKKHKSISQIKKELDQSLKAMRADSLNTSFIHTDKQQFKLEQQQKIYQYRSRGYLREDSSKAQEVKQFLRSIRQKKIQQRSKQRQMLNKEKQMRELQDHKKTILKEEQRLKLKQELRSSLVAKQQKKIKQVINQQKKKQQAEVFLRKFKQKPPNYIIVSERYKKRQLKQEKQRQQFLQMLKQSKRHSSLSEMRDEMKKYDEIKALHQAQRQQEYMRQQQLREQIQEKLSRMYKSKIHSKSLKETPVIDRKKIKQQQIIKMQMYSQQVPSLHPPKISQEKRQQLSRNIQALLRKQDHSIIKKHIDGQDIFLNRQSLNPRKLGLQYLEEVKKITSQIQRKPPPTPKQPKFIGKSPLKKIFCSKKPTISNWKEVVDNKHYTLEEKEQKLQIYLKMIEENRLRQQEVAKRADQRKSLIIQQTMDHYQIERAEAKLALLKSLK